MRAVRAITRVGANVHGENVVRMRRQGDPSIVPLHVERIRVERRKHFRCSACNARRSSVVRMHPMLTKHPSLCPIDSGEVDSRSNTTS